MCVLSNGFSLFTFQPLFHFLDVLLSSCQNLNLLSVKKRKSYYNKKKKIGFPLQYSTEPLGVCLPPAENHCSKELNSLHNPSTSGTPRPAAQQGVETPTDSPLTLFSGSAQTSVFCTGPTTTGEPEGLLIGELTPGPPYNQPLREG